MKKVKVLIKDCKGNVERVMDAGTPEELCQSDEWDEGDVSVALDVLSECAPASFASDDGKLYDYDFEIVEDENIVNDTVGNQETDSSKWKLKNWLIDRQINFFRDMFHYDESTLNKMRLDVENRDLEDVMCCYDLFVGGIEHALFEYGEKQFYERCID